jgi:uncharacterized protein (TIGR03435 family)
VNLSLNVMGARRRLVLTNDLDSLESPAGKASFARFGSGAPSWARQADPQDSTQAYFRIEAAAENPEGVTVAQLKGMLQTMLAERFDLRLHRETQTVQAYVFHVAKSGSKLKEATGDIEMPRLVPGVGLHGKTSMDTLARFSPILCRHSPISATLIMSFSTEPG